MKIEGKDIKLLTKKEVFVHRIVNSTDVTKGLIYDTKRFVLEQSRCPKLNVINNRMVRKFVFNMKWLYEMFWEVEHVDINTWLIIKWIGLGEKAMVDKWVPRRVALQIISTLLLFWFIKKTWTIRPSSRTKTSDWFKTTYKSKCSIYKISDVLINMFKEIDRIAKKLKNAALNISEEIIKWCKENSIEDYLRERWMICSQKFGTIKTRIRGELYAHNPWSLKYKGSILRISDKKRLSLFDLIKDIENIWTRDLALKLWLI